MFTILNLLFYLFYGPFISVQRIKTKHLTIFLHQSQCINEICLIRRLKKKKKNWPITVAEKCSKIFGCDAS